MSIPSSSSCWTGDRASMNVLPVVRGQLVVGLNLEALVWVLPAVDLERGYGRTGGGETHVVSLDELRHPELVR